MEDRLRYILSSVNDWLRFAESKNAALLVANSAVIFGVLRVLKGSTPLRDGLMLYLYFSLSLLVLSGALCFLSFIPQLEIPWLASQRQTTDDDNLVFYAEIADYSPQDLLKALYRKSNLELDDPAPLEEDYAAQIVVNSRIAVRKYRFFSAAIWLALIAIVTPVGAALIYLLKKKV